MQIVEDDFGVPLFKRSKNKIELNDTGLLAVQNARNVLSSAESTYNIVQADDFAMEELTRNTELPFFVTDVSSTEKGIAEDRIALPVEDDEANVSYYLVSKDKRYVQK